MENSVQGHIKNSKTERSSSTTKRELCQKTYYCTPTQYFIKYRNTSFGMSLDELI